MIERDLCQVWTDRISLPLKCNTTQILAFFPFYNIQPLSNSFIQEKYISKDRLSIKEMFVRYNPILGQSEGYECSCWCWLRSPFTRVVFCWVYNGNKSLYPYLAIHHQIGDTQEQTVLGNPYNARVGIPPCRDSVWYPSCRQGLMQSLQERCLADKFDCVSFVVITPLMILLGMNGHEWFNTIWCILEIEIE